MWKVLFVIFFSTWGLFSNNAFKSTRLKHSWAICQKETKQTERPFPYERRALGAYTSTVTENNYADGGVTHGYFTLAWYPIIFNSMKCKEILDLQLFLWINNKFLELNWRVCETGSVLSTKPRQSHRRVWQAVTFVFSIDYELSQNFIWCLISIALIYERDF